MLEERIVMKTNEEEDSRHIFRGELALVIAVMINSLAVILMLYSGSGISAISSVPYAFEKVFPVITLGTWTYIFQALLILSLMIQAHMEFPMPLTALPGQSLNPSSVLNLYLHLQVPLHLLKSHHSPL